VDDSSISSLLETLLSPLLAALNGGVALYTQRITQQQQSNSVSPVSSNHTHHHAHHHHQQQQQQQHRNGTTTTPIDAACQYFSRVIQAVGFTTKTFPPQLPTDVQDMYRVVLESSLKLLSLFPNQAPLRTQIIFLFHRMVSCLNKYLVPYLPLTLPPVSSARRYKYCNKSNARIL
jgi:hypothetical protein